jgi:hypothetical protein
MHQLRHRDLDHRDLVHHLVHDLAYRLVLRKLMDHLNDMDHLLMVHLFRCVVDIVNLDLMHRQDVVKMDALQILGELNLDAVLTFLDVVRHFLVNLEDVQVGVEPHRQLKTDYFQDVVGVEPHHLLKRDCYLDEVLALAHLLQVHFHQRPVVQALLPLRLLLREML